MVKLNSIINYCDDVLSQIKLKKRFFSKFKKMMTNMDWEWHKNNIEHYAKQATIDNLSEKKKLAKIARCAKEIKRAVEYLQDFYIDESDVKLSEKFFLTHFMIKNFEMLGATKSNTKKIRFPMRECKEVVRKAKSNMLEIVNNYSGEKNNFAKALKNRIESVKIKPANREQYEVNIDESSDDEDDVDICPITQCKMQEPVTVVESYQTYEFEAIKNWLSEKNTDPITNKNLKSKRLIPNLFLIKRMKDTPEGLIKKIEEWNKKQQKNVENVQFGYSINNRREPNEQDPLLGDDEEESSCCCCCFGRR